VRNRTHLGCIRDDYVLGVVCGLTGLTGVACREMKILDGGERQKLFGMGLADAPGCRLEDVARDLWRARRRRPAAFDRAVARERGEAWAEKIRRVALAWRPQNKAHEAAADAALANALHALGG
jgi:hypothetical protein